MNRCPHCGEALAPGQPCARCLLAAEQPEAERIFEAALRLPEMERAAYVAAVTTGREQVRREVEDLFLGLAEAEGSGPTTTLHPVNPAPAWTAGRREEQGAIIDHFQLLRLIGEGGMGDVWEAQQLAPITRRVALKVIRLGMDTPEVVARFERERRTLGLMKHPHIAQVFEAGATQLGRPYFAMELVEGEPLTTYCQRARLDLRARLELFLQVCEAVEHAHRKGIIHRDLKPSNLLVAEGKVKVIDFGVAKATQPEPEDALRTQQWQVLGTPAYMSPEQSAAEHADIDTRSDVYALGAVLYELLCGAPPFDPRQLSSCGVAEIQRILRDEEPPRPSARPSERPDPIPPDLDWLVLKALSKERERRYPSAAALASEVRRFLAGEVVRAVPPTWRYRFRKYLARHRAMVAAQAAVVLALTTGLAISLLNVRRARIALQGEAAARAEATLTVVDVYTRTGLDSAKEGEATRVALWFAQAAATAASLDPLRTTANQTRWAAWRQERAQPLRAFEAGVGVASDLRWHPTLPALIVRSEREGKAAIWELERESRWKSAAELPLEDAVWTNRTSRLVTAGGGVVRWCEFPSGRELRRLEVPGPVQCLALDGEDRWVAIGSTPPCLWDLHTGASRPLPADLSPLRRFEFSRSGEFLLLQGAAQSGLCALAAPERLLFPAFAQPENCRPGFLGAGEEFFTSTAQRAVLVRRTRDGGEVESYPYGADEEATALQASPDGRFIVRCIDPLIERGGPARRFPVHQNVFEVAEFSADGALLATGSHDGVLRCWTLPEGEPSAVIGWHQAGVSALAFSPDARLLASAQFAGGPVRIWRRAAPPQAREIEVAGPSNARLSPDGRWVLPSGVSHFTARLERTRLYDVATAQPAGPELVPGGRLLDAAFAPDAAWVALIDSTKPDRELDDFNLQPGGGTLQFWDPLRGARLGAAIALPHEPRGLAVHPTGRWVAIYDSARGLYEIEVPTRAQRMLVPPGRPHDAMELASNGSARYSPDGRFLLAWGMREPMLIWDRQLGRLVAGPAEIVFQADFLGEVLATSDLAANVEFRNLSAGMRPAPPLRDSNWLFVGRFHPAGELFLTAGRSARANLWHWRLGRQVGPALPHTHEVFAGLFLPAREAVVTGGQDRLIHFWDQHAGLPLRPALPQPGEVFDLVLTPDGRTLICGSAGAGVLGHRLRLFDVSTLLPATGLEPQEALRLAELEAAAEIRSGGLNPLRADDWLRNWQAFRARHPGWHRW